MKYSKIYENCTSPAWKPTFDIFYILSSMSVLVAKLEDIKSVCVLVRQTILILKKIRRSLKGWKVKTGCIVFDIQVVDVIRFIKYLSHSLPNYNWVVKSTLFIVHFNRFLILLNYTWLQEVKWSVYDQVTFRNKSFYLK